MVGVAIVMASVGLPLQSAGADVGGIGAFTNFGLGGCLDGDINQRNNEVIRVQAYRCHGRVNQTWVIEPIPGSSAKMIVSFIDGTRALCLEPNTGNLAGDNAQVLLTRCTGSTRHQWIFERTSDHPEAPYAVSNVFGNETLCATARVGRPCTRTRYYLAIEEATTDLEDGRFRRADVNMSVRLDDFSDPNENWYVPTT